MLGLYIHSNLGQIHVCADSCRSSDARRGKHILYHLHCKVVRREVVKAQIIGSIDEHLVYRIRMNVLRGDVLKIGIENLAADLHIIAHPGRGDDEGNRLRLWP